MESPVFCIMGDGNHGSRGSCVHAQKDTTDQGSFWLPEVRILKDANQDWWDISSNVIVTTEANWNVRKTGAPADNAPHHLSAQSTYWYVPGEGFHCGISSQPCCEGSACATDFQCVQGTCQPCGLFGEACCTNQSPCDNSNNTLACGTDNVCR